MKATCPNDPNHKEFLTVAHVTEDWVVDEFGEFVEIWDQNQTEVVANPHPDNTWTCKICGATAVVDAYRYDGDGED
jgi:hypothetical protein